MAVSDVSNVGIELLSVSPQRRVFTVKQFAGRHPAFSVGALRWLLFHRESNGLEAAVVRCGRRLLLDAVRFFQWLDSQQNRREGKECR